jgi:peptidoglycan/LPS O-acetylase OafA/YrhL
MSMVIAQHCSLLPVGWTGVWLFYVISGFFIARGFLRLRVQPGRLGATYWAFMRHRLLRIAPVYFLYLLVSIPFLWWAQGAEKLGDLIYLATFTNNWQIIFDPWPGRSDWAAFGHLWTVSVEMQFYAVFPFLALLVPRRRQATLIAVLVCLWPAVRWAWWLWLDPGSAWGATLVTKGLVIGGLEYGVWLSSICHLDAFLIGGLIAHGEGWIKAHPRVAHLIWAVALTVTAVYTAVYLARNYADGARGHDLIRNILSANPHGQLRQVFAYVAVDLMAAAVLVHVIAARIGTSILSSRMVAGVGRVSYGAYIVHLAVLLTIGEALQQALGGRGTGVIGHCLQFAVSLGLSVAIAAGSLRWFEGPITRRFEAASRTRALVRAAVSKHSTIPVQ